MKPVGFTRQDASRIAKVVRTVEGVGSTGVGPYHPYRGGDDGDPVRLGKTTAAWTKGTLATITLYEDGTPPSETTATPATTLEKCVNKVADVENDRWVIVAKGMTGSWYLVEYERRGADGSCRSPNVGGDDLTKLSGYNATKTQILGHVNGCLQWIDTTACP